VRKAVVMKSGNLNFLEVSGPLQACNGTGLPLFDGSGTLIIYQRCVYLCKSHRMARVGSGDI